LEGKLFKLLPNNYNTIILQFYTLSTTKDELRSSNTSLTFVLYSLLLILPKCFSQTEPIQGSVDSGDITVVYPASGSR